jgi:hypothetical protein
MENSNEYFAKVKEALIKNYTNVKKGYVTFDNFWKDFEYGLRDFDYISPGGSLSLFYRQKLKAVWDSGKDN